MEEPFETFLAQTGRPSAEAFARNNPHPFLFREVLVGEGIRKLSSGEIEQRTRRFEKLVGRHAGYALMQQGHRDIEKLLKEAVVSGEKQIEARITRLRAPAGAAPGPITIGSGPEANVRVEGDGIAALALSIEATADRLDYDMTVRGGEVWYDSQRLPENKRVRLDDGVFLQLGSDTAFQTFTPIGFAHFMSFQLRLKQARAAAGAG
ncbi:hypothetical protein HY251_09785 [bacterium]|nr:hypothetical protein [bacterium]